MLAAAVDRPDSHPDRAPRPCASPSFDLATTQGLRPCKHIFPKIVWLLDRTPWLRGCGMGLRLPSPLLRYITFKFTMVGGGWRGQALLPFDGHVGSDGPGVQQLHEVHQLLAQLLTLLPHPYSPTQPTPPHLTVLRHIPVLHDLVKAGMRMTLTSPPSLPTPPAGPTSHASAARPSEGGHAHDAERGQQPVGRGDADAALLDLLHARPLPALRRTCELCVGWVNGSAGGRNMAAELHCDMRVSPGSAEYFLPLSHAQPPLHPPSLFTQFSQWALDPKSFALFDYGTAAANRKHYGTDRPPSLAGADCCQACLEVYCEPVAFASRLWCHHAVYLAAWLLPLALSPARATRLCHHSPSHPPPHLPTCQSTTACWTSPWTCWRVPQTASSPPPAWCDTHRRCAPRACLAPSASCRECLAGWLGVEGGERGGRGMLNLGAAAAVLPGWTQ